jgi:hypothetical protein
VSRPTILYLGRSTLQRAVNRMVLRRGGPLAVPMVRQPAARTPQGAPEPPDNAGLLRGLEARRARAQAQRVLAGGDDGTGGKAVKHRQRNPQAQKFSASLLRHHP